MQNLATPIIPAMDLIQKLVDSGYSVHLAKTEKRIHRKGEPRNKNVYVTIIEMDGKRLSTAFNSSVEESIISAFSKLESKQC